MIAALDATPEGKAAQRPTLGPVPALPLPPELIEEGATAEEGDEATGPKVPRTAAATETGTPWPIRKRGAIVVLMVALAAGVYLFWSGGRPERGEPASVAGIDASARGRASTRPRGLGAQIEAEVIVDGALSSGDGARDAAEADAASVDAGDEMNRAEEDGATAPAHDPDKEADPKERASNARERRKEIEALIVAGRLEPAQKALLAERRITPDAAWVHYLLGEIYFQRVWRKDALREWDDALRLSAGLRSDRTLQKHLCVALDERSAPLVERLLQTRFTTGSAIGLLKECVRTTDSRESLRGAVRALEKLGAGNRINRGEVALRELTFARSCEDRRNAVETLGRLRERRALGPLGKLERARVDKHGRPVSHHACLGNIVREALTHIRQ